MRCNVTISNAPLEIADVEERLILRKGEGESIEHVAMKLLAYVLFYHPGLEIERSLDRHYKPDLVRTDDRGEVVQWIECGSTTVRKLDRLTRSNPYATIKIVKATASAARIYQEQAEEVLRLPERVHYLGFEGGFVTAVGARLWKQNEVGAFVSEHYDRVYLDVAGETLQSALHYRRGV